MLSDNSGIPDLIVSSDNSRYRYIEQFLKDRGLPHKEICLDALKGDGSTRLFLRISSLLSGITFILMENPPINEYQNKENIAYLMIGKHLLKKGAPLPEIYSHELKTGRFIMEDMGDKNLQSMATDAEERIILYEKTVDLLFRLQIEGAQGFNTGWCCQTEKYDRYVMRHYEADYFRDSFLSGYLGMKEDWKAIDPSFDQLESVASLADNRHFLHRDFQSRNIMISGDKIGILDWQGGRLGPLQYDLASLMIDPYMGLQGYEKNRIYDQYLSLLKNHRAAWVEPFRRFFPYLAIQRNLQILGAYSYLTKVQQKTYFEKYIPPALKSLHLLLEELSDPRLSPLKNLVNSVASSRHETNNLSGIR